MNKVENEPRVADGPGFMVSLKEWMRRAAVAVNALVDWSAAPTAPTPPVGDDSTKVATTAWVRFGMAVLLAPSGYVKLPNWLGAVIFQWGSVTTTAANTGATWTFPMAFPNRCTVMFAMTQNGSGSAFYSNVGTPNASLSSATVSCTYAGTAVSTCFAVGY